MKVAYCCLLEVAHSRGASCRLHSMIASLSHSECDLATELHPACRFGHFDQSSAHSIGTHMEHRDTQMTAHAGTCRRRRETHADTQGGTWGRLQGAWGS